MRTKYSTMSLSIKIKIKLNQYLENSIYVVVFEFPKVFESYQVILFNEFYLARKTLYNSKFVKVV